MCHWKFLNKKFMCGKVALKIAFKKSVFVFLADYISLFQLQCLNVDSTQPTGKFYFKSFNLSLLIVLA